MTDDRQERIRQRAYALWQRDGQKHGDDQRHWHQAAAEIDAEDAAPAAGKPARKYAPRKSAAAKPAKEAAKPVATGRPRGRKSAAG